MPTTRLNRTPRLVQCAGILLVLLVASGCQSGVGPLARWQMARDGVLAPPPTEAEVGDTRGALARLLQPEKASTTVDPEVARAGTIEDPNINAKVAKPDPETQAELDSALKLYKEGKLSEAERILSRIDRWKIHSTERMIGNEPSPGPGISFSNIGPESSTSRPALFGTKRQKHAPWGERVLFYLGESQYRQGKLTAANNTFSKLATTYPYSPYLEQVALREYAIANEWLEATDPSSPPEKREKWGDRFNGRLPLVDVRGHALQVLEHVRHHDPQGKLADVAVMRIADFYFDQGSYEEASTYYDQLISDHPKSPLLRRAHLRGIEAKLKAYVGPEYDAVGLEEAHKLISRTMSVFPDRDEQTSEFLSKSLDLINDQQAEITFQRGEFYRQTGYPGAAELNYAEVRARWPASPWAALAKEQLELIAKAPRKEVLPSKIMTTPGAPDPYSGGGGMGSMLGSPGGSGSGGFGSGVGQ